MVCPEETLEVACRGLWKRPLQSRGSVVTPGWQWFGVVVAEYIVLAGLWHLIREGVVVLSVDLCRRGKKLGRLVMTSVDAIYLGKTEAGACIHRKVSEHSKHKAKSKSSLPHSTGTE